MSRTIRRKNQPIKGYYRLHVIIEDRDILSLKDKQIWTRTRSYRSSWMSVRVKPHGWECVEDYKTYLQKRVCSDNVQAYAPPAKDKTIYRRMRRNRYKHSLRNQLTKGIVDIVIDEVCNDYSFWY